MDSKFLISVIWNILLRALCDLVFQWKFDTGIGLPEAFISCSEMR